MAVTTVEELPAPVLRTLRYAAHSSPDGRSVALVFATREFLALLLNWVCHALAAGVRWFVLVAMDVELHAELQRAGGELAARSVLLPRASAVTKLRVIGERQRFGLAVLQAGISVVHSDADALWLRDPWPLPVSYTHLRAHETDS